MNTIGSRTTRTEAYPLPYSEFCLPIVSGNGYVGGLNYGFGIGVTNFDLTSVTIVNNSEDSSYRWTGYTYIVVGAQPQWGYKTSLTDEETLYPLPFTVLLGISAQLYRHPATSNTVHSILVNVTETSFKYYAGQYNLSCRPVPDADGWWFAFGISQLQWGFTVFDPVYYKNVNFTLPLSINGTFCAFSTGYDPKGSTFLWHSMSHFNNVNVGVTGFVFDSRYTFTGLGYLAICWQKQWGKIAIGSTTVTYPLPYETYSLPVTVGLSPFYGSYYGNYYRPVLPSNPDLDGTALTTETIWEGFYIVVGQ